MGLILSMPLAFASWSSGRYFRQLNILLGDRPPLSPVETFYQRIFAGDTDEVEEHAEALLRGRTPSLYYGEVALKAFTSQSGIRNAARASAGTPAPLPRSRRVTNPRTTPAVLRIAFLVTAGLMLSAGPTWSAGKYLDPGEIDRAEAAPGSHLPSDLSALTVKVEILLDRAHFSPGEIDGKSGENVDKALAAFAKAHDLAWQGKWTPELWQALTREAPTELFTDYTTTSDDLKGPFLERLPAKMEEMKDLAALSYVSPKEELAERFHVSEEVLTDLNPESRFRRPGEKLMVPAVADDPLSERVSRIVVNKSEQTVAAFDAAGKLVAFYPATVGSEQKPAPSGELKVTVIKRNPTYHYSPKYHFKGVRSQKAFTIKPGPNNPVGSVWIGLTGEGYGIHGTPEPNKVSKSASHGCVRLTNWDALQLASAVRKGVPVQFVGGDRTKAPRETSH